MTVPAKNFPLSSIRQAFGDTLLRLAKTNKNIYVVNADLKTSLRLEKFASWYRPRFIECGVAESNAAALAAGLAKTGKTVFLTSFACFSPAVNWASIRQSVCLNQANVKIIGSHAGLLTGTLGASHQMLEDLALMRPLPHLQVFSPADATETAKVVKVAAATKGPMYIRLVRPDTPQFFPPKMDFVIGKSHILQKGSKITILGHGPILAQALILKNNKLEIINCSSIKPLDQKTIIKSIKKTKKLIVLEDHQQIGGLGEAISHLLLKANISAKFIHLAVNNQFGQSAKHPQKLYNYYGLGPNQLKAAIAKLT